MTQTLLWKERIIGVSIWVEWESTVKSVLKISVFLQLSIPFRLVMHKSISQSSQIVSIGHLPQKLYHQVL